MVRGEKSSPLPIILVNFDRSTAEKQSKRKQNRCGLDHFCIPQYHESKNRSGSTDQSRPKNTLPKSWGMIELVPNPTNHSFQSHPYYASQSVSIEPEIHIQAPAFNHTSSNTRGQKTYNNLYTSSLNGFFPTTILTGINPEYQKPWNQRQQGKFGIEPPTHQSQYFFQELHDLSSKDVFILT